MNSSRFRSEAPGLWPVSLREAGLLILVALLLSAASWLVRPVRLPLAADPAVYELELVTEAIDAAAALDLFDEGAHLFIDTRPGNPDERPTIAGAFVLREATLNDDLLAYFDDLYREDPLVLFGGGDLAGTNNVASKLLDRGFAEVLILKGGLGDWERAGGQLGQAYLPDSFPEASEEVTP